MCFITGNGTFNHFDKVVSSMFLYYKITYFPFAVKKHVMLGYLETTLCSISLHIFAH